jgi:DNA-binding winged helix-turn-helix (wHTH) protein
MDFIWIPPVRLNLWYGSGCSIQRSRVTLAFTVRAPLGSNQAVKRVQFGPYAVDFRTGEVHKHGIRISLQEQPLQVLQLLIERQGDLLTREEARNRIWPGNTVADADAALSTAIRKIRTTLADSAESPRYIETLPKRGYRFIAPIEVAPIEVITPIEVIEPNGVLGAEPAALEAPSVASGAAPFAPGRRRRFGLWATLAGIALTGLAAAWLLRPAPPPRIVKYTQMTNDGQEKITFGGLVADGLHVYVNEAESLVRISPQGGRATLIPASWTALGITPDGARPLVVPGNGKTQLDTPFWTLEAAGGQPQSMGISGTGGAWSPDGRRFAYSAKSALYIANNDGADARKLADLNGQARSLTWSPDGASLRFDLIQPGVESTAVWEISTPGGNLHAVFSHGNVTVGAGGQWTSDGSYFLTWRGSPSGVDLWALRERGGLVAPLLSPLLSHLLSHEPQAFQLIYESATMIKGFVRGFFGLF